MLCYDYECPQCEVVIEVTHSIKDEPTYHCEVCGTELGRLISGGGYVITGGLNGSLADHCQSEHTKKIKDPERAVRMRQKSFGKDAVGDPSMTTDPRHIVKRGRTLGGAQKELDKKEFIKAAAKDPTIIEQCIKANRFSKNKK